MIAYLVLTLAVWLAYSCLLSYGFVSDDLQGILECDGKLVTKEVKIFGLKFRITDYGEFMKWLKYSICGGNFQSSKKDRNGKNIPLGKLPVRYHALQIIVFNLGLLLFYTFLNNQFGINIALPACLLIAVYPIGAQVISWNSAIGYTLCFLWTSLELVMVQHFYSSTHEWIGWLAYIGAFAILHFLAVNALFSAVMTSVIMLLFGWWHFAIVGAVVAGLLGFDIILHTINFRKAEFKKQAMGTATGFRVRKIIVAFKTFQYYVKLALFPKRMGLYHEWGYHYDEAIERENGEFWLGLLLVIGAVVWFFLTPSLLVKFSLLWFCAYISPFLNLISVQQFVTERYLWLPSMGLCLLLASFFGGTPIYFVVLGICLMRTWAHLPTFQDELSFYQSNIWNFPKSEVAYGNLGVTQLRMGLHQSALDSWMISGSINPDYDVPFYNISSHYKSNGIALFQQGKYGEAMELLKMGAGMLEKAIKAKTCHFRAEWEKELTTLQGYILDPFQLVLDEFERVRELLNSLKDQFDKENDPIKKQGHATSISDHELKMAQLTNLIGTDLKKLEDQLSQDIPEAHRIELVRRKTYINSKIQGKIYEQAPVGVSERGPEEKADSAPVGVLVSSQSV